MFNWFYIVEFNDESLTKLLLNDEFFIPLIGVFEYNPSLVTRGKFRDTLENEMKFKEVII